MYTCSAVEVNNLDGYIRVINEVNEGAEDSHIIIYRGQKADYPLVPKVARINSEKKLEAVEKEIFSAFQREAVTYLQHLPVNLWEWLSIAQHHGLPTRLLDWSYNPLIALFFTVSEDIKSPESNDFGVVWVYMPPKYDRLEDTAASSRFDDPFAIDKTKVYTPNHIIPRIRAQSGLFTVHKLVDNRFIPLQEDASEQRYLKKKVVIRRSDFQKIRNQLAIYGVHTANVFPDLDGLAKHISSEYILG